MFTSQTEWRDYPGDVCQWTHEYKLARPTFFPCFTNGKKILVDSAHNRGSAQTLADFIATLLPSIPTTNDSFNLTYMLGLSHSPPKIPLDTLAPLFSPSLLSRAHPNVRVDVAALKFSPPDDMPWVKAQPPLIICDTVKAHCPYTRVWSRIKGKTGLSGVLDWATNLSGGDGLVALAGSLHLVVDFYWYMNSGCNTFLSSSSSPCYHALYCDIKSRSTSEFYSCCIC
jgi:hypothetical protein